MPPSFTALAWDSAAQEPITRLLLFYCVQQINKWGEHWKKADMKMYTLHY